MADSYPITSLFRVHSEDTGGNAVQTDDLSITGDSQNYARWRVQGHGSSAWEFTWHFPFPLEQRLRGQFQTEVEDLTLKFDLDTTTSGGSGLTLALFECEWPGDGTDINETELATSGDLASGDQSTGDDQENTWTTDERVRLKNDRFYYARVQISGDGSNSGDIFLINGLRWGLNSA